MAGKKMDGKKMGRTCRSLYDGPLDPGCHQMGQIATKNTKSHEKREVEGCGMATSARSRDSSSSSFRAFSCFSWLKSSVILERSRSPRRIVVAVAVAAMDDGYRSRRLGVRVKPATEGSLAGIIGRIKRAGCDVS